MSNNPLASRTITVQPRWVEGGKGQSVVKTLMIGSFEVCFIRRNSFVKEFVVQSDIPLPNLYKGYPDIDKARTACEAYLEEWLQGIQEKGGAE